MEGEKEGNQAIDLFSFLIHLAHMCIVKGACRKLHDTTPLEGGPAPRNLVLYARRCVILIVYFVTIMCQKCQFKLVK